MMFERSILTLGMALLAGCASAPDKAFVAPVFPMPPEQPRFIYERTLISSADVEVLSSEEKFKMFATGVAKDARGLSKPFGVAVHRGRIYVTDTIQNAVVMFDIPGQKFTTFGISGVGILGKPLGIDIADNGEVYVVDSLGKRVVVYDGDGKYLRSLGGKENLERPSGVAVNREGTRLYVVDTGGVSSEKHCVQVFDALTGEFIRTIGKRGNEPGDFNLPLLASTDKDGNLYVMDSGNFRVERFDANGEFQHSFGKVGRNLGDFARPKGIDVDREGNVYVVDTSFGNFQIFDREDQLLLFIGERTEKNEPAKYILPADIEVDEDGRIYVVEQFFRRVDVFRPYGMKAEEGFAAVAAQAR
ncbi:MAG TPA: 6-bladed beta-propeller [Gammaproteobacteria bacterium]